MSPLPSVLKGNLAASSEQILHRPPSFEKYFKSSRNIQYKSLQIEKRFSHYEQKMMSKPVERCSTKIPRRLQTRKLTRPLPKANLDVERIEWNARLAAWLHENPSPNVEYFKISDKFTLTEKQLYYCSACHEFFHLNLRERDKRRVGCPRFRDHHVQHVKPVAVKKVKKSANTQPRVVAKDPFGDRSNLNIPSLLPPKQVKRPVVRVVVDVPRLPSVAQTVATSRNTSLPPVPSGRSSVKFNVSRAESSEIETPVEEIEKPKQESPLKLPDIFQTPTICENEDDDEEEQEEVIDDTEKEADNKDEIYDEDAGVEENDENAADEIYEEDTTQNRVTEEPDLDNSSKFVDVQECEVVPVVESFDDLASNAASVCCEVDSVELDLLSVGSNFDEDETMTHHFEIDSDDADIEIELDLSDETTLVLEISSPSPTHDRPRPPPPDLPTFRMDDSPDIYLPKPTKNKAKLSRRKAMALPTTKQELKPNKPEVEKPNIKRMSKDELAKRMQRAKDIHGHRKKYYDIDTDASYDVTTTDEEDTTTSFSVYDDSFLEKYCIVSSDHLEFCRRRFSKLNKEGDGLITSEEVVNGIRKMFSPKVLDDVDLCYIFRILETTSFDIFTEKMNLKLFAIVTAMAQKISQLDPYMKHLIGRVNIELVDWKLCQARQLFEKTMVKDHNGIYKMPMESLWLELHAGGISEEHEKQVEVFKTNSIKNNFLFHFLNIAGYYLHTHTHIHIYTLASPTVWSELWCYMVKKMLTSYVSTPKPASGRI